MSTSTGTSGTSGTSSSRSTRSSHSLPPITKKAGRIYLDTTGAVVAYPFPIDLAETHREIMLSQLNTTIFGSLILTEDLILGEDNPPPRRVLEVCCDTGWWSAALHQQLQERDRPATEFVGLDIKPPPPDAETCYEGMGMTWEYVQHDVNDTPWPLPDNSFDLVMIRNVALALDSSKYSQLVQEYVRVLRPGGTLELWEHDYNIRSMRPSIQQRQQQQNHAGGGDQSKLDKLGLYPISESRDFGPASNACVAEYNAWIKTALADLHLPTMPCSYIETMFSGHLVEGSEDLDMMRVERVAVPFGGAEGGVSWEQQQNMGGPRILTAEQEVVRRTALEGFVGMVEAFEPLLRAGGELSQVAWEDWIGKARKDWLQDGGFGLGECLEFGVWSLRKK
ncbi:S-adenosyl-L-methionine-dependent methyltransferase [Cryphonectria parasitica EP155]|uniref:S-adenosyl-L-methionine-dependent methyltransferase n=1 Tax=Cryphonectria parasitica (strain ATCC 38755 / EP155) TaxID=660469 RepID=A0A9P4XZT7_CRYP1|nr:S-adenosyl-L-methionine-dependent methyltransferase [Cryphonectria parasitica EP155]KAF3763931.1 S-adenosyl-L-methionine-dependent methyltransferase [Cryphonectria parasitica EP155]